VDDDPTLRLLAREAISEFGIAVEEAEDRFEALEKIRRQPADLILPDERKTSTRNLVNIAQTAVHTADDAGQVAKAGGYSLALTEELLRAPEAIPGYFEAGIP
jgi:DNA-binding NtrC family response regulator